MLERGSKREGGKDKVVLLVGLYSGVGTHSCAARGDWRHGKAVRVMGISAA